MLKPKFNPAKSETTCRLGVGRIKLAKNKKGLQQRQLRKEIAELLRNGKQEYARIRVEAIIRENLMLQAYEILELFLELIAVRSALIAQAKEIPRDMVEAISSVIYAAQRVPDLPELTTIRGLLAAKYGKEYVAEASSDVHCSKWQVNEKLKRCLMVEAPSNEDKLETLSEIAQEFHVEWDIGAAARDLLPVEPPSFGYDGMAAPPGPGPGPGPSMHPHAYMPPNPGMAPSPYMPPPQYHHQPPPPPPPPVSAHGVDHLHHPGPYTDVQSAVQAATVAAQQAQAAADYARQLAGQHIPGTHHTAGPVPQPGPPAGPPSHASTEDLAGWLRPAPPSQDGNTAAPPAPAAGPAAAGPGGFGGYTVKPEDELRAAYDNAQGPPSKHDQPPAGLAPPSAPAAPPPAPPSAPAPQDPPSAPAAPKQASSELDELQKRFEALKRL